LGYYAKVPIVLSQLNGPIIKGQVSNGFVIAYLILKEESTTLSWNVMYPSPSDAVYYSRRMETLKVKLFMYMP